MTNRPTPETDAAAVGFARVLVSHGVPGKPKFEVDEIIPSSFARKLERERDELLSNIVAFRDECRVAARDLIPAADPSGDARMAYGSVADQLTALIETPRRKEP